MAIRLASEGVAKRSGGEAGVRQAEDFRAFLKAQRVRIRVALGLSRPARGHAHGHGERGEERNGVVPLEPTNERGGEMNRRGFLSLLATGAVGACVAAKVPTGWLPEPVQRYAACEFLRKAYNDFSRGRFGQRPREMFAGRELYEAFEGEIIANQRYVLTPYKICKGESLMFKGLRLRPEGRGWTVRIAGWA